MRFDTADVFGGIDDGDKYLEMVRINRNSLLGLVVHSLEMKAGSLNCLYEIR